MRLGTEISDLWSKILGIENPFEGLEIYMLESVLIPVAIVGPIVLTLGLGLLLRWLGPFLTRYLKRNVPAEATMKALNASVYAPAAPRVRAPLAPNREPIVLAGIGFVTFIILGFMFLKPDATHVRAEENKVLAEKIQAEAAAAAGPALGISKTAGEADAEMAKLPQGNLKKGETLFTVSGCIGCHAQEKDKKLVGPSFYGVYTRAAERKPGYSAKAYIYESIVNPNEFVVQGFQPNLMTQTFAKSLNQQNMADLLAWIEQAHAEK